MAALALALAEKRWNDRCTGVRHLHFLGAGKERTTARCLLVKALNATAVNLLFG
jgi:hypothetical protein